VGYSISAFVYRTFIVVAILFWIFDRFLLAGIVLGGIAAVGWVGMPLFKGVRYLFSSPALRRRRGRAFALVGGGLFATALLLLLAPFPLRTRAEGVVWIPDEGHVRSGTDGFVETVVAEPGARVETGDLLIRLRDPVLSAEVRRFQGRVRELEALYRSHRAEERHEAVITRQALAHAGRDLARARERAGELEVRSRTSGTFVLPRSPDLPGRFVQKGEALAWVVDLETITVRAVVSQDDVDLVRQRTIGVQVRLAERIAETYHAEVLRLVPGASEQLPSLALGSLGGGEVPTDPSAPSGDQAVQSLFEVELELPSERPLVNAGGRVYVRFDHGREPLGLQWYRGIRQLFLSRLHV
jgi:putative peptide zinc metalloprotease protein